MEQLNTGNQLQMALQTSKELALFDAGRKPKFLDDLENFLIRELNSLGVEEVEPNDTRLQVLLLIPIHCKL